MKNYIINENRLREPLEGGGVDNWSWYSDSLCDFLKEDFNMNIASYIKFFKLDKETRPDEFEEFEIDFSFDDIVEFDITSYKEYL